MSLPKIYPTAVKTATINPSTLLGHVSTLGELMNAVLTYGAWGGIRGPLTKAEQDAEQVESNAQVLAVFGQSGVDDLVLFTETQADLVYRASLVQMHTLPAFALALVRAGRAAGP